MEKLTLILKDISDIYIRDNFFRLLTFLNGQVLLAAGFQFFEVDIAAANAKFPVQHGLKFIPTDIIFLSVFGNYNFYFLYNQFDKTNIYINAAGPCIIRFLAGRIKDNVKST